MALHCVGLRWAGLEPIRLKRNKCAKHATPTGIGPQSHGTAQQQQTLTHQPQTHVHVRNRIKLLVDGVISPPLVSPHHRPAIGDHQLDTTNTQCARDTDATPIRVFARVGQGLLQRSKQGDLNRLRHNERTRLGGTVGTYIDLKTSGLTKARHTLVHDIVNHHALDCGCQRVTGNLSDLGHPLAQGIHYDI